MASIAEIMDFLLSLMRDDDTRREFERAPDAALENRGLADVTSQDVRDARLMMADCGAVQPRAGTQSRSSSGSGDDPIREIHHTTTHFEVGDVTTTVITVNDNDTVIVDSFNNDVVAIQDNDTTDVDVISIVDDDEPDEEQGEPTFPAGEEKGEEAEPDAADAAEPNEEPPGGSGSAEPDSGVIEGFVPEEDSGFGVQPELGAEAGFTPEPRADDSLDELVG